MDSKFTKAEVTMDIDLEEMRRKLAGIAAGTVEDHVAVTMCFTLIAEVERLREFRDKIKALRQEWDAHMFPP